MPKLSFVEGIGPAYEEKLNALGIKTTEKFFEVAATKKGRKDLAESCLCQVKSGPRCN